MNRERRYPQPAADIKEFAKTNSLYSGVLVDLDGTIKSPGLDLSDEVFKLISDCINKDFVFGIVSGRSQDSIDRIIISPFLTYLQKNNVEVEQTNLFISGNNGAIATVGIYDRKILYSRPLDIENIFLLPPNTLLRRLVSAYLNGSLSQENILKHYLYDSYSLYLDADKIEAALRRIGLENMSMEILVKNINTELSSLKNKPSLRAFSNTGGIDVVNGHVSKATAIAAYRSYVLAHKNREIRKVNILTIGDNPTGNDREFITRPGGCFDITLGGPHAVVSFIKEVTGIDS